MSMKTAVEEAQSLRRKAWADMAYDLIVENGELKEALAGAKLEANVLRKRLEALGGDTVFVLHHRQGTIEMGAGDAKHRAE